MGNGQDWVGTAARLDGETDTVPKEGTILSFLESSYGSYIGYGDVAFVEKVYPDGSFFISETNINNNPDYIFRHITFTDSTMNFAYMTK